MTENLQTAAGFNTRQYIFITIAATVVFLMFTAESLLIHGNMRTAAFDLGIFDQAFWRYSRFLDTFNTVRGLHILGDHFSPIDLIFGPLYQIYPSVAWPLALQALSVAAGGVLLFSIARLRLAAKPWMAFGIALSYYIHPAVHSTLLWDYHEIVLASGLYMCLIWSYIRQRQTLFVVMVLLLLSCREDMPVTVAAFGLLALVEKRRSYAMWAIGLALVWGLFAVKFAMPYFNGHGYFRHENGTLGPFFANITNPHFYAARLLDPKSLQYLWQIAFPVGFIAIFSPRYLLPALPTLAINMIIGAYNTQIGFHYSVSIMPFVYWGAIEALRSSPVLARVTLKEKRYPWLAACLVALTLFSYAQYSSLNLRKFPMQLADWDANAPKREFLANLDTRMAGKGVAASDYLLPQLSHREHIYLFPNPWKVHYWAMQGENPHHPNQVDYIVIGTESVYQQDELLDYLTGMGVFHKEQEKYGITVFKRIKLEDADRAQAIADLDWNIKHSGIEFANVSMSHRFETSESEFRRLDVDLLALQHAAAEGWSFPDTHSARLLDVNFNDPDGNNSFHTRYLRAVITVDEAIVGRLDLGSDDGVTVWLNGMLIHENIVARPARLGDDKISVKLHSGSNVFVFRVNNIAGAWRLLAKFRQNFPGRM